MDFHIRLGTAHRRLARPAHPSCPHLGDERPKLPARHQQEGTAAIGSGAKPKNQNTKRRRARHRHLSRHKNTIINRGFKAPFSQPDWYNISPPFGTFCAAARAAERFLFLIPPFTPAACWCARTIVESMACSSSAGGPREASVSNAASQTPSLL